MSLVPKLTHAPPKILILPKCGTERHQGTGCPPKADKKILQEPARRLKRNTRTREVGEARTDPCVRTWVNEDKWLIGSSRIEETEIRG